MTERLRRIGAWLPLAAELALGIGLTALVVVLLHRQEQNASRAEFGQWAAQRAVAVELSLRESLSVLAALTGVVDGSPQIETATFDRVASALLREAPAIESVGWAPLVPAGEREAFEAELQAAGLAGRRISERGPDGALSAAEPRDVYFPIRDIVPRLIKQSIIGVDVAFNATRRAALDVAARHGIPVATQRITLITEREGGQYGFLVIQPVFDHFGALRGYTFGAFRIGVIVSRTLAPSGKLGNVAVFDRDAPPGEQVLFPPDEPGLDRDALIAAGGFATDLTVATRRWSIIASPPAGMPGRYSWQLVILACVGLVTSLNVVGFHAAAVRRRSSIEAQVRARTGEAEAALAQLQASEQRFRDYLETASDWYWEADATYRFTYVSARADEIGIPREELWGLDQLTADDAELDIKERRAILDRRQAFRGLRVFTGGSKGLVVINLDGTPVFDADGAFAGYRGSARDTTGAAKAEAVQRSARVAAEQATKSKSDFLANMSHEIRTPMNGVLGMAQILGRTALDDQQRQTVNTILRSAENLLAVLNDILDYSKLEAGKITIETIDCSLTDLIGDIVSLLRPSAEGKGLRLETTLPAEVPRVMGDPTRIRQILLNLLSNAVKFSTAGTIRLTLDVVPAGEGCVDATIAVADCGIGMSRATLKTLFKRFTQGDASSTRRYGGTGLGLAITRELTQLMGGTIGVTSELGKGSCFTLRLPMPLSTEAPAADAAPAPARPDGPPVQLRILVADDDEINRTVIGGFLRPYGHYVTFVHDGDQAVVAARYGDFDLVLMDVMMPRMDGPTASLAIRALEEPARDVPIIALTANAMAGDRERYLAAGMTDYVSKPISWAQLIATIERVLQVNAFPPDLAEAEIETLAGGGPPVDAAAAAQLSDFVAALDLSA